jgi:hypothetical protein
MATQTKAGANNTAYVTLPLDPNANESKSEWGWKDKTFMYIGAVFISSIVVSSIIAASTLSGKTPSRLNVREILEFTELLNAPFSFLDNIAHLQEISP